MKRLTLLRHGHAEPHADGGDHERALDARGRAAAARAARAVLDAFGKPDLALASAALRTRQTAEIFCQQASGTPGEPAGPAMPLRFEAALYHAPWRDLLATVQGTGDTVGHLLLVGHNPGISELALHWANSLNAGGRFTGFAPAGWCSLEFAAQAWGALPLPVAGHFAPSTD